MPLAELVQYLNRQNRDTYGPGICSAESLAITPAGVIAQDEGLFLRSVFQPISAARGGRIVGHEALLRAESPEGHALTAADLFLRSRTPEKLIYLDRLCRTLHALNFLHLTRDGYGTLFLNIEGSHVRAVTSGHGLVFEAILKRCGLSPDAIFFEIRAGDIGEPEDLAEALAAYRSRGYRIAIDQATPEISREALNVLRPELVKFDVRSWERWRGKVPADRAAADAAQAVRQCGGEVAVTHVSSVKHLPLARAFSADFLQGHYLASPSPGLGGALQLPMADDVREGIRP